MNFLITKGYNILALTDLRYSQKINTRIYHYKPRKADLPTFLASSKVVLTWRPYPETVIYITTASVSNLHGRSKLRS